MANFLTLDREEILSAQLKVVGVGGGGCNAIESMMLKGLKGVEYVAVNTDAQVLKMSSANYKIQIGTNITRGLGAGADPNVGRKAIEEDREKITKILEGSDMVFVTAGMGGGTGTGGAPVVAAIAKSLGALVIGIVTKPFKWEGKRRMLNAEEGIHDLRRSVDSLIVIPNDRLLSILDATVSARTAFEKPNEVLHDATRGIADIITIPGIINVDFADVRSVMNSSGEAMMGSGTASGENRAIEAAQKAISSPLLDGISIKGAKNILLNVTGSDDLTMQEIDEGNKVIYEAAGEEANVIFGWVSKEEMNDSVSYTVIATGFGDSHKTESKFVAEKKEIKKEKEDKFAGYTVENFDIPAAQEELDTPTIFRVKGTNKILPEEKNVPRSGFKIEQLDAFETVKAEENKDDKRERGGSSFLRMMMD
ncbi:MAG: cell division protein FtsZ [Ignavibacteriales bacterium]|nr:cell division protein FtsZ [Ignavibacteriota bacterium]MCB9247171.1 cell division protein FtsZ [Ignavibacteriales bacterium]